MLPQKESPIVRAIKTVGIDKKGTMSATISFYTLGCRLNQSETAVIERSFENDGYKVVDFKQPADIVVINTCTVTENGDTDTRRLVQKVNRLNPQARIALIGCQAQIQKEKLANWPNVRWVVGNAVKMDLRSIIKENGGNGFKPFPTIIAPTISREPFTIPPAGIDRRHTRANLKIQDGCDFFCSFCEIPYARGRARSRVFEDILLEANALVSAGHKELVITGINVGTYAHQGRSLLDVIEALEQIEGLKRIRISSIEPTTIPKKLIEKMAQQSKLCRYLHIPLQSGSDEILKLMKRKYTLEEFDDFIQFVSSAVPEVCLGTDVIVGFPTETEKLFLETFEYFKKSPIHYFHVFSYSRRTMAKSQNFNNSVSPKDIQRRSEILRELSQRKRGVFYESFIGTTQKVLFEQSENDTSPWAGLTDHSIRVKVKNNYSLANQLSDVRLEKIEGQFIVGSLLK